MNDLATALASEARRTSVVAAVRRYPALTLGQLAHLVHNGDYADELAKLTVTDLRGATLDVESPLRIQAGETVADAVMRVFRGRQSLWLASSFFVRHLGLQRWTAQQILADLAERGLLDRTGKTSGTRYRFAAHPHLLESDFTRKRDGCS